MKNINKNNLKQIEIYSEPQDINYIICKVNQDRIAKCGYYNGTKEGWILKLEKVKNYKYVLCVVNSIVKKVYEVDSWQQCKNSRRIKFNGKEASQEISSVFLEKRIPDIYRKKGCANPVQYKKEQ